MDLNSSTFLDDMDNHREIDNDKKTTASRVDDDENITEENLESDLFPGKMKPVMEGQPMGGQSFGKNNLTPAGDDKNNPSQNAGYNNAYFARTEPLEEHPENTNFTANGQDATPDYAKAQTNYGMDNEAPKPEKTERGDGENDRPHPQEEYQEGTVDNDEANVPGPEELPDQQKVGEKVSNDDFEKDHIET